MQYLLMQMFFQNLHATQFFENPSPSASVEVGSDGQVIRNMDAAHSSHEIGTPDKVIRNEDDSEIQFSSLETQKQATLYNLRFHRYFLCYEYTTNAERDCMKKKYKDYVFKSRQLDVLRGTLWNKQDSRACKAVDPDTHEWEYIGMDPFSEGGKVYIDKSHSLGPVALPVMRALFDKRAKIKDHLCLSDGTETDPMKGFGSTEVIKFIACIATMDAMVGKNDLGPTSTGFARQRFMTCLLGSGLVRKGAENSEWLDKLPKAVKEALEVPFDLL